MPPQNIYPDTVYMLPGPDNGPELLRGLDLNTSSIRDSNGRVFNFFDPLQGPGTVAETNGDRHAGIYVPPANPAGNIPGQAVLNCAGGTSVMVEAVVWQDFINQGLQAVNYSRLWMELRLNSIPIAAFLPMGAAASNAQTSINVQQASGQAPPTPGFGLIQTFAPIGNCRYKINFDEIRFFNWDTARTFLVQGKWASGDVDLFPLSGGSGITPSVGAATPASAFQLIEHFQVVNQPQADILNTLNQNASFDQFQIQLTDIVPSINGSDLQCLFSSNGGVSFDAVNANQRHIYAHNDVLGTASRANAGTTPIIIMPSVKTPNTNPTVMPWMQGWMFKPQNAGPNPLHSFSIFTQNSDGNTYWDHGTCWNTGLGGGTNALRFKFSAGNISCFVKTYGVT